MLVVHNNILDQFAKTLFGNTVVGFELAITGVVTALFQSLKALCLASSICCKNKEEGL